MSPASEAFRALRDLVAAGTALASDDAAFTRALDEARDVIAEEPDPFWTESANVLAALAVARGDVIDPADPERW